MRPTYAICLASVTLLLACGGGERSFDETLAVEPEGELEIELLQGDVEVRTHPKDEVHVEARISGADADRVELQLGRNGNGVALETEVGFGFPLLPFFLDVEIEVRAWVPARYGVDVETERGSIDVAGIGGESELETSRAPVQVQDVSGDVSVRTSRAPVRIERTGGNVLASTSRSPIEIREAGGSVRAESSRAPISVSFKAAPAGRIETSRAEVDIRVPKGAGFDLDARAERGSVQLANDLRADVGAGPELETAVNGGGESLRVRTSRDEIRISSD